MTEREKYILEMMKKANALRKNWTREGEDEIWTMCDEWNRDHYECGEIFMCERVDDETGEVNGFYIEDDYWTFEY